MQDLGTKLRMVVMAHRRIALVKKVEESFDLTSSTSASSDDTAFADMPNPLTSKSSSEASADGIFVAETENLAHEPFETTDEIKALTQEVIKTIRDIIVSFSLNMASTICFNNETFDVFLGLMSANCRNLN